MKNKFLLIVISVTLFLCSFNGIVVYSINVYEDFVYDIYDDEVTITNCSINATEVTIPETIDGYPVTTIGVGAFSNSKITRINIPESVTRICDEAFYECGRLARIDITNIGLWCNIDFGISANPLLNGGYLYLNGELMTDITIPNTVTTICYGAFEGYTGLESITIPNTVTEIGNAAFEGCTGLTSINIPTSVKTIGISAFRKCTGITDINIPGNVSDVKGNSFEGCTALKRVTVSKGVTNIGMYAFGSCSALEYFYMPATVTTLGRDVFQNCGNLKEIHYGGSEKQWELINGSEKITSKKIVYNQKIENKNTITVDETLTKATVSFVNVDLSDDMVIVLASYTDGDKFIGFTIKDVTDSTLNVLLDIKKSNEDVKKLKAFLWSSLDLMAPVSESITYEIQ